MECLPRALENEGPRRPGQLRADDRVERASRGVHRELVARRAAPDRVLDWPRALGTGDRDRGAGGVPRLRARAPAPRVRRGSQRRIDPRAREVWLRADRRRHDRAWRGRRVPLPLGLVFRGATWRSHRERAVGRRRTPSLSSWLTLTSITTSSRSPRRVWALARRWGALPTTREIASRNDDRPGPRGENGAPRRNRTFNLLIKSRIEGPGRTGTNRGETW